MKKIISFILVVTMILATAMLVSCAKEEKEKETDAPVENEYLEELDFEGTSVRFALGVASPGNPPSDGYMGFDVDEKNGDAVVDSLYDRNAFIEELLNVKIEVVITSGQTNFTETVTPSLIAGDDDYDVLVGQQANDIDMCLQGYLYNINAIAPEENYVDVSGDWWATDYINNYQYKNGLFWLAGPLSLKYAGGASCIFVNSRLYDTHFKATYGDIYDYVREGKWTIDDMAAMSSAVYSDRDSSETITDGDVFGTRFQSSWSRMELLIGCGIEGCTKAADGTFDFSINNKNTKYINIVQKCYSIFNETSGISGNNVWDFEPFLTGNQLFLFGELFTLSTLREMPDNFYLIPNPKYDLNQEFYRAAMADDNQLIGIAFTCTRLGATTATLELMAYHSAQEVTPLYFDEVLKYKYSRDDDTAEMVDLVHDSVYTDFVLIWEKWIWDDHWIRYTGFAKNVASALLKSQDKSIERFNETLRMLDELDSTK